MLMPIEAMAKSRIAAMVGEDIITTIDVQERIKIILDSASISNPDNRTLKQVASQALQTIINEKLFEQEAKRLKLTVNENEVKNAIKSIEAHNNFKEGQFEKMFKERNLSIASFKTQIRGQLLWRKIIDLKIAPKVVINENEVDEALESSVKQNYEVSFRQIFIPINKKSDPKFVENKIAELNKLRENIKTCNQFGEMAAKVGSSVPNDEFRVPVENLHSDIRGMIRHLSAGQVSQVIKAPSALHLVMVCDKEYKNYGAKEKEEIRELLHEKKILLQAEHYLHDLRQKAIIEIFI
jgi:peptidyl-prolyl cis-trans isomerase SurA